MTDTHAKPASSEALLRIEELAVHFHTDDGVARAVDGVTLELYPGETLGVVGESGSGKSVTALAVMRLLPAARLQLAGRILYRGTDLLQLSEAELARLRGARIAMVFQEPMTALNPVFTVGDQIMETVRLHRRCSAAEARAHALAMLAKVGIPAPERRIDEYPHQLSGGMRQRVMLAIAMSCDPDVLIADEPTTALDVTIQAQILDLVRELQARAGMSMLLITHDLGVVAETAHRVAVMYGGRVVETADVRELFQRPLHPYTVGLLRSLPERAAPGERLYAIPGSVPGATRFPSGCRFRTRCALASERCAAEVPALRAIAPGTRAHLVACHHVVDTQSPEGLP